MRTIFLGLLAVAGIAIVTPVVSPASAQLTVETPAGDVRVGVTVTAIATVTMTVVGITGTAITAATLSPSTATTGLSVEFGAATKYCRRRLLHGT